MLDDAEESRSDFFIFSSVCLSVGPAEAVARDPSDSTQLESRGEGAACGHSCWHSVTATRDPTVNADRTQLSDSPQIGWPDRLCWLP